MKVIVAPLNWGLGHASRSVPLIHKLIEENFTPVIASDGAALLFLQNEFPDLEFLVLPSYRVHYGKYVKGSLLLQLKKFMKVMHQERKVLDAYLTQSKEVVGIISDNRFGAFHKAVPSVYMSHQLTVLSGLFTPWTTYLHRKIIQKFHECWVPDDEQLNLSGLLSERPKGLIPLQYIGPLSRLERTNNDMHWDLTLMLSGPEPRRTQLEQQLFEQFCNAKSKVLLIQGLVAPNQEWKTFGNLTLVNFLLAQELQYELNRTHKIIARAGYSSIMDLCVLGKKVVLIPTKGQNEQEYLARYFNQKFGVEFLEEDRISDTNFNVLNFRALPTAKMNLDSNLFDLFKRKGKL